MRKDCDCTSKDLTLIAAPFVGKLHASMCVPISVQVSVLMYIDIEPFLFRLEPIDGRTKSSLSGESVQGLPKTCCYLLSLSHASVRSLVDPWRIVICLYKTFAGAAVSTSLREAFHALNV